MTVKDTIDPFGRGCLPGQALYGEIFNKISWRGLDTRVSSGEGISPGFDMNCLIFGLIFLRFAWWKKR